VRRVEACLVDVYDTLVNCDFSAHGTELPALAAVSADAWNEAYAAIAPALNAGRFSSADGFARVLRACGTEAGDGLVRELVARERDLLFASARLYDDAIPFLMALRAAGIKIGIVSNCTQHTRPLLAKLGVSALADAVILSYEVGAAKPSAEIFRRALDGVGVAANAALFVDDQASFCAGGAALGISTAQIVRGETDGNVPGVGIAVVRSLAEIQAMLGT
jgi:HAD superfamily hydrolase (TIGR01509 family)